MRTIRTKVYKFDELVVDAQQNAIEQYRNGLEIELENFKEGVIQELNEIGFNDAELQYSLSYSQGDGLSFGCQSISKELASKMFKEVLGNGKDKTINLLIDNSYFTNNGNTGRYCYASKNDIEYIFDENSNHYHPNIENVLEKVESKLQNLYLQLCKKFENDGYAEIEYQNSNKAIEEILITNDYEFTSNGNLFSC